MDGYDAMRLLRKFLADERAQWMESYNKGLPQDQYHKTTGRIASIDATSAKLDEIMKMKGDDE